MTGAPRWSFTGPQKAFGALSGLGSGQLQIGASLLPVFNIPYVKDRMVQTSRMTADAVGSLFPGGSQTQP